jgi:hypothetical protein
MIPANNPMEGGGSLVESQPAAVTYIGLPITSGGAHGLGRMPARVAYARTMAFLEACTERIGAVEYQFAHNDVIQGLGLPHNPLQKARVNALFGSGVFGVERVAEAFDFLDEISPQPERFDVTPISLWTRSTFRILDPATGAPIPGQDPNLFSGAEYESNVPLGTSGLRLIIYNRASLAIELCIPTADEALLHRIVPWLQASLPFKFSPKQWRIWTPTRGGSFKGRKLVPSW